MLNLSQNYKEEIKFFQVHPLLSQNRGTFQSRPVLVSSQSSRGFPIVVELFKGLNWTGFWFGLRTFLPLSDE